MKAGKRIALGMVIFLMVLSEQVWGSDFSDGRELWVSGVLTRGQEAGLFFGTEGRFEPERPATRAEGAALVARVFGATQGQESGFTDVPSTHWAADLIGWGREKGLWTGIGGGAFAPDRPITRQELWAMAGRALGAEELDLLPAADGALVAPWAKAETGACLRAGLIPLDENDCLYPTAGLTRGELADFIWHLAIETERIPSMIFP